MRAILLLSFAFFTVQSQAQLINVEDAAKRKTENKVNNKADQGIDKSLDKIEEGIGNLFKKKKKKTEPEKNETAANSKASKQVQQATASGVTDFSAYKSFDFIPGKDLLFFDDFSISRLGDGRNNWYLRNDDEDAPSIITGIKVEPGNWLKTPRKGVFFPNDFNALPEECTIEFDMYSDADEMSEMEGGVKVVLLEKSSHRPDYDRHFSGDPQIGLNIHPYGEKGFINLSAQTGYNGNLTREEMVLYDQTHKEGWNAREVNRISIYRKGPLVKLYVNEQLFINLSNALPKRTGYGVLFSTNMWGNGIYISNIRIATNTANAAADMKATSKFVSSAIYFDVNSARVKPESWPALVAAAEAVKAADAPVKIVGHTDTDGDDAFNLVLSQKRAESVKSILQKEFGINSSLLTTEGKGETEPVDPLNTPLAKGKNRRVEFISN